MGHFLKRAALIAALILLCGSYNPGSGPGGGVSSVTGSAPVSVTAGTTL